ncbi:MAG: flippase [Xanthomonadales bacterium]|jgi:O-antigen/teichoic acid export membrane protein|nr:flippase [Xanthomonadales bacterium]
MRREAAPPPARRLARNFSWLGLQELVIRLVGLATAIYLARVLSPASYGALGLALAVVSFASVFVRAGTGSRGTRMTARDPGAVPKIFADINSLRIVMALVMIGLLIVFAPALGDLLQVEPLLIILCAFLLLRPGLTVVWAFRGLDRMHVPALTDMAEKILVLIGLLLLVHGKGNDVLWAPVVELMAILVIVAILYHLLTRLYGPLRLRFDLNAWREISGEALPLSMASLLGSVYMSGGVLLLGWLADTESAALFLVAQKVMLTLLTLLGISTTAAFPSISRFLSHNKQEALDLAARILRYFLVVTTPLFLLVIFHARFLIELLFGSEYRDSAAALVILMTAIPFLAAAGGARMLLRAIPKPASILGARLLGAMVLLTTSLWFIPEHGTMGAAAALAAGEIVSSVLMLAAVRRATGGLPWCSRCLAPLLAGLASATVYIALGPWPLFARLLIAAVTYGLLVILLKGITTTELRSMPGLFLPGDLSNESENRFEKQSRE